MNFLTRYRLFVSVYSLTALITGGAYCQTDDKITKPRLIVLTDISALQNGKGEPDDSQSMIRLMLYSNDLDLEGLIATSNLGHGQRTRPELIKKVVETYAQVHFKLLMHDRNYPPPISLAARIKQGSPVAGPLVPVEQSVGDGKDTEGSDWIIAVVDKGDPRPVWIAIWGGSADLAQALWKVKATRKPDEVKEFISRIRVHAVYDQDKTGQWIRAEFPELFYIFRHHGIRGMYRGGDTTLVRSAWVETHVRNDHGALGALYENYNGGDIWVRKLGRVHGMKEGDTPSFLYLLNNGLNAPDHPEWGNWGGRFMKDSGVQNLWVEAIDSVADYKTDPDPRMAALYRWRPAWQADFAARLDWCVKSYGESNHAPRFKKMEAKEMVVSAGKKVRLTAPMIFDPDNDDLHYNWFFYPEECTYRDRLPLLTVKRKKAEFVAPMIKSSQTLHAILQVTDSGTPSLTSYKRFIILIEP